MVSGSIVASENSLSVSFQLQVSDDVEVLRAGPCVLHEVLQPGSAIETDLSGDKRTLVIGADISARR